MTTDLRRLWRIVVCAAISGLGTTLAADGQASAAPSAMTVQLCAQDSVDCSIRTQGTVREGVQASAQVTGRSNAQVQLRLYRVVLEGNRIRSLQPVGKQIPVGLNRFGNGSAAVPVPATDGDAGWSLLSLADLPTAGLDTAEAVGAFLPTEGRRPILLGDGFAEQKPAGQNLDLQLAHSVATHRFAVEFLDDAGVWREVTVPGSRSGNRSRSGASGAEEQLGHVAYQVPRGLRPRAYEFRLRNLSDPAEPQTWRVVPSTNGQPQPRQQLWRPPALGAAVEGAALTPRHDEKLVSGGLLGVAAACVLGAGLVAARRPARVVGA